MDKLSKSATQRGAIIEIATHRRLVDPKKFGQFVLLCSLMAQSLHFLKFLGAYMCRPMGAMLARTISHVIERITLKQMGRSKAFRIVAAMQDVLSCLNGSYCEYVGLPMNQGLAVLAPVLELSIAQPVQTARPLHARIILRNRLKKLFEQFKIGNLVMHLKSLLGPTVLAPPMFAHRGAFSILPQGGII